MKDVDNAMKEEIKEDTQAGKDINTIGKMSILTKMVLSEDTREVRKRKILTMKRKRVRQTEAGKDKCICEVEVWTNTCIVKGRVSKIVKDVYNEAK